jgi:hypothetical protein
MLTMVDTQDAKTAINEITTINKRLNNNLNRAKKSVDTWDFKTLEKSLAALGDDARLLVIKCEEKAPQINRVVQAEHDFVSGDTYAAALEKALIDAGLYPKGQYPNYELIPFKLTIDPGQEEVILSVGRKKEKISAFAPQQVATWVAAKYKNLAERRFDSQQFCKELLEAYQIGNKLAFKKEQILWGRGVSLSTIYELLTVRRSARQEYPKEQYIYDLGRLKEQLEIRHLSYKFEFGFARNQAQALLVTDSQGRESRIGSLIIYKEGEKA